MLIVMSPLASLAMYSKTALHLVTGECSGDCDICGCSPESRANHTCCCAKKNQKRAAKPDCCAKKTDKQNAVEPGVQQKPDSNRSETVFKCGCPCGTGKVLSLTGFGSNELLPVAAGVRIEPQAAETLFTSLSHRLASRHGDPPDPPPRLSHFS